jgi:hypothetical protein
MKPALTPKEWEARGTGDDETGDVFVHPDGNELCVVLGYGDFVGILNRHGVAALALHGMPFGFSHADVNLIREMALFVMAGREELRFGVTLSSLADRIAALLPPEPTP